MARSFSSLVLAGTLAAAAIVAGCGGTAFDHPGSLAEAKTDAAARGVPILLTFSTSWCGVCQNFARAVQQDATLRKSLASKVSFVKLDAEQGEGKDLREFYPVRGFPTFVLTDAHGEYLGHFLGYGAPDEFVNELDGLLRDPVPIAARRARFETAPTLADARALARYHDGRDEFEQADAYYVTAQGLVSDPKDGVEADIARLRLRAVRKEKMPAAAALEAADKAVAAAHVAADAKALLASSYADALRGEEEAPRVAALVRAAYAAATAPGADVGKNALNRLQVAKALYVDGDPAAAVALRRSALPEGWEKDHETLNEFAWWCFEHRMNLEEAGTLAERGVDLAPAGTDKANVLDTLAEIRYLQGRRTEAIAAEERAIAAAPDAENFRENLKRFRAAAPPSPAAAAVTSVAAAPPKP